MTDAQPHFEDLLSELDLVVKQLEQGSLSLDQSLNAYEQGVRLAKQCQQLLDHAQQRIQVLSHDGQQPAS